jgi:hypothetical protein
MSQYTLSVFPSLSKVWPDILSEGGPFLLANAVREAVDRMSPQRIVTVWSALAGSSAGKTASRHIAPAMERGRTAVPVERALSQYEIQEIARSVAGQLRRARREKEQPVLDVEVVEATVAPGRSTNAGPVRSPKLGRPSKVDHLIQEMKRRAACGELHSTYGDELKHLLAWMKTNLSKQHRPTIKTLYNESAKLKAAYNELKLTRKVL